MKPPALHDRIRQDIEARIMSGEWGAGHRIPAEHQLMASYGCSRMTVNKAISALSAQGFIDRRKRAGSFVAAPTVHRATIDIPDLAAEIEGLGRRYTLDLLARKERPADAADRAQLASGEGAVLALTCLHGADDRPFAVEERLINLALVPEARDIDFAVESPGRWLLGHVPWSDATHRITAVSAPPAIARLLDADAGAACLSVERWTWRTAERITYVRLWYPGDHALLARFGGQSS